MRQKRVFQQLFLDFLGEAPNATVRKQEGVYQAYTLADGRVAVVALDLRFHANPLNETLLGDAQWQFVESFLAATPARLVLFGSGIQMLPTGWFDRSDMWCVSGVCFVGVLALTCVARAGYFTLTSAVVCCN